MNDAVLVINSGSSSIKFAIYGASTVAGPNALYTGAIEGIGRDANLAAHDSAGTSIASISIPKTASHDMALSALLDWIERRSLGLNIVMAGHRVVHGGSDFTEAVKITPEILAQLNALSPLAPQHQPHNLAAIRALARIHPELPQIACFDTSFHTTQSSVATAFALPRALSQQGIKRYGFHGLSYEYIATVLPEHIGQAADGRVVVAHLGHGASMCAMVKRRSVATTMGFSALDGLMMGTRCGSIDPGVILYLLDHERMNSRGIERLLYEQSGLLGVSGESDDMRDLLLSTSLHAAQAVELFVYRIARELGSLVAALGGLDALVFTGGIGEHSPEIRARVCRQSAWLGIALDDVKNRAGGVLISEPTSQIRALALHTDEESIIARSCMKMI